MDEHVIRSKWPRRDDDPAAMSPEAWQRLVASNRRERKESEKEEAPQQEPEQAPEQKELWD